MVRLIDADALVEELHKHFGIGFDEDEWWNSTHVLTAIEQTPTIDAVPVEYIEYEKDRINRFIQIAVKHGDMKEADRLTAIEAVMDAIISNWRYTTGPDWRGERKE